MSFLVSGSAVILLMALAGVTLVFSCRNRPTSLRSFKTSPGFFFMVAFS